MKRQRVAVLVLSLLAAILFGCAQPQIVREHPPAVAPDVRPGMTWSYLQIDDYTKIPQGTFRLEATGVTASDIQATLTGPQGQTAAETYGRDWSWKDVSTRGWDWLSRWTGTSQMVRFEPPFDSMPFPVSAGQRWKEQPVAIDPDSGQRRPVTIYSRARYWEKVNVPAGEFVALRIERTLYPLDPEWWKSNTFINQTHWYAPEVNGYVMYLHQSYYYDKRQDARNAYILGDRLRWMLESYTAPKP